MELHFFPCSMNNPIYHARLQKWFKRNADLQCSHIVSLPDGTGDIAIPTTAFNVVYQLTHLYHHFFDEGIGMRQIIDYYYVVCDFYKVYQNSSKITPSLFTIKEGSTSHPAPLTLRGEGGNRPTRCCICPTCPSPAGGSLTHSQALALSKRARDVTAPSRCSEPLRSKVGGPSKVSPDCAGWDRLSIEGDNSAGSTTAITSSASTALDVVQKELKELGLWKFAGGIMYIMQEVFGMPASLLIVPPNEKYGRFVLNEVLEAGNFGKHDARNRFGRSKLGHNLQRVYRDIRLVRYFPGEALCEPLFRIWHFFWRMKNKK